MLDFVRQFYDKRVWWAFAGLLLSHLIAASVQGSAWAWVPLIVIGGGTVILSCYKLEWGLAVAFLELFVGGHGHLIDVDVRGFLVSIREVIFAAVMLAWLMLLFWKRQKPEFVSRRDLPFALLALAVLIAAVKGLSTNELGAAFDDLNGYLTLAYFFPIISLRWEAAQRRLFLQTLAVAAIWISATTLLYLYAFTHLPGLASHELYTFVRDARLAEVTLQTTGPVVDYLGNSPWYFRVFQQAQAIVVAFELLLITATLALWREQRAQMPSIVAALHLLMISTILASLSRSFWIGSIAGFATILGLVCLTRPVITTLIKRHFQLAGLSLAAAFILFVIIAIPIPTRPDLTESSFYKGSDEHTREVAVSSRWNLLPPMLAEIWHDPIFGSGFGETVTFISDDPRLRDMNISGEVTTYRFEWGYHDIWLKMGLPGLLSFSWLLITVLAAGLESVRRRDEHVWIVIGLVAGVMMIFVTHIFSPYLNHPIGLGLIMFSLPFLPFAQRQTLVSESKHTRHLTQVPINTPTAGVAFKR